MTCVIVAQETWTPDRTPMELALHRAGYTLVLFDPEDTRPKVDLYCTISQVRCRACRNGGVRQATIGRRAPRGDSRDMAPVAMPEVRRPRTCGDRTNDSPGLSRKEERMSAKTIL